MNSLSQRCSKSANVSGNRPERIVAPVTLSPSGSVESSCCQDTLPPAAVDPMLTLVCWCVSPYCPPIIPPGITCLRDSESPGSSLMQRYQNQIYIDSGVPCHIKNIQSGLSSPECLPSGHEDLTFLEFCHLSLLFAVSLHTQEPSQQVELHLHLMQLLQINIRNQYM